MQHVTGFTGPALTYVDGRLTIPAQRRPATLAEMARQGTHHQVRPLRSGLTGSVTDPQHLALATAAEQGQVLRGGKPGQASVKTLTALARKGYLTLTAFPGSRKTNWAFGRITEAGRRELARLDAEHGGPTMEIIHKRTQHGYAVRIECGITGPVRFTEKLYQATCPRCQHEGTPVDERADAMVEAAHAEALAMNAVSDVEDASHRQLTLTLLADSEPQTTT